MGCRCPHGKGQLGVSGQLKSIVKHSILGVLKKGELCKNGWTDLNDMSCDVFLHKEVPFGVAAMLLPV